MVEYAASSTPGGPGAYVVRSTAPALDGRVHYELVDMAGTVHRVTLARHLTVSELADPVLRHAVARRQAMMRP